MGELTQVLDVAQSSVSRHVRRLREGGLVEESREGGFTWLLPARAAPPGLGAAWPALRAGLREAPDEAGDDARLADVLRARHERDVGWGRGRARPEPGRSWSAWARALGHVLPPLEVVDLGAGEGALTREIARWARRVVAVEPDGDRLAPARDADAAPGAAPITWIEAPLDATGLADASFDLTLLSQALHREADVPAVLREARRLLRPGGRLLVLDLCPHEESWVRDRLGHRHLGFAPEALEAALAEAGVEDIRVEEAARRRGNPFTVLVASGVRSEDPARSEGTS